MALSNPATFNCQGQGVGRILLPGWNLSVYWQIEVLLNYRDSKGCYRRFDIVKSFYCLFV